MSFRPVGGEITALVAGWAGDDVSRERLLLALWPRVVGSAVARRTRPVSFGDGVLTVAVLDPSWRPTLADMTPRLRARINGRVGREWVGRLVWEPA